MSRSISLQFDLERFGRRYDMDYVVLKYASSLERGPIIEMNTKQTLQTRIL